MYFLIFQGEKSPNPPHKISYILCIYGHGCKDSRTVCLYCSLNGDKIAEFVGYLHVRRLLACSSATCISVGYSTYMCQFSFNIKATLFVCSSLALNLLTTRLVNLVLLLPVDLASFPNSFSSVPPWAVPVELSPSVFRQCSQLIVSLVSGSGASRNGG